MKVLLQHNSSSKVREISEISELFEVIERTFDLIQGNYFLQKYDEDFQEYVDFEDLCSLEDKCKIKIIDIPGSNISQNLNMERVENEIVQGIEEVQCEVILNLKKQWPEEIRLPTEKFSRPLLTALENKKELNWTLSSELVNHLANYAYNFKCYPNKKERKEICELLIHKFPYLKNEIGIGTGGWEVKLLNKLKKIRQGDCSVEVQLNRIKRKSVSVPKNIKLNPEKGEVNWAPNHIDGETEASQNMHKEIMKDESKKSASFQDKNKLRALMSLTYSFRRSAINNKISIKALIQEYPVFFQEEEQFDELQRLTSIDAKETFFKEVNTNASLLLEMFRLKKTNLLKKEKEEVEGLINCLKEVEDEEALHYVKTDLGLLVLPYLLREPLEYFVEVVQNDDVELTSVSPKIFSIGSITSNNFVIVAEDHPLIQTKHFVTAVGLLLSFYFTMNISYPKQISCTLTFLQKYFLKVNGKTIPPKVLTLYQKMISLKL